MAASRLCTYRPSAVPAREKTARTAASAMRARLRALCDLCFFRTRITSGFALDGYAPPG